MLCKGWINLYRSGHFHRCGKPHVAERHAGDVYLDEAAARADIDPPELYIATVPIEWSDPDTVCANAADSTPVPLRETRAVIAECKATNSCHSIGLALAAKVRRLRVPQPPTSVDV